MVNRTLIALTLGLSLASAAQALDYRSVSVPVAIFYDAPSVQGKKLYLVKEGMPLEVLVQVERWTKVRDAEGSIAWIERNALGNRRTVVVTASPAEVRESASTTAPLVFQAEKWVALELLEAGPQGWVKVKHRDGASGFVRITQVWGL